MNYYESRRRIKMIHGHYMELHEDSSQKVLYFIGIKRMLVDNVSLTKITKEMNEVLENTTLRKNEMSAVLTYFFGFLRSRYPTLGDPKYEKILLDKAENTEPINPIKLEIIKKIIQTEVEKCLNYSL